MPGAPLGLEASARKTATPAERLASAARVAVASTSLRLRKGEFMVMSLFGLVIL
ncbi:hypothetical protein D3C83_143740 [compost metagenome]